jgi:hypothetical protein
MSEYHGTFRELPLTQIEPEGWLRHALTKQVRGLTGHIEVAGYPYDTYGWAGKMVPPRKGAAVEDWWPYEQTAYWVDGALRAGYLLGDSDLIDRAGKQVDYVLAHQGKDGYLGPKHLRKYGWQFRWSHNVFFRAMMARYHATGDASIPRALQEHYLSGTCKHDEPRDSANIETCLWAYAQTGEKKLLQHAVEAFESYNKRYARDDNSLETLKSDKVAHEHGVTYNELAKLPAILYMYTGRRSWLKAARRAFEKLDRNHMLITGVNSSSEHLTYRTEMDCQETCDTVDYSWSMGYLLMATGDADCGDRLERALFNAGLGAIKSDFKALQYFSGPNQAVAARNSDHNRMTMGGKWMSYRPKPGTECCTGQFSRLLPNYAARMWMSDGSGGVAAVTYGPSRLRTRVGRGEKTHPVEIVQRTQYPFSDEICFELRCAAPVHFALHLRIPGWARGAAVLINGARWRGKVRPGTFIKLDRDWSPNDTVVLKLPAEVELVDWPTGGVALERGPLVFSLRIGEKWARDRKEPFSTDDFPAWNCTPSTPFNYAMDVSRDRLDGQVQLVRNSDTVDPWTPETSPLELRVPVRRVSGWKLRKRKTVTKGRKERGEKLRKVKGDFLLTPELPDPETLERKLGKSVETAVFVPLGCTHLRMTLLPRVP